MDAFESRMVGSLEKVFCRRELAVPELRRLTGLRGEVVSFQVACKAHDGVWVSCSLDSPLSDFITLREVGMVPCDMPAHPDDPDILSCEAGLYPDPLYPLGRAFRLSRRNWHALWVTVRIPVDFVAGVYPITLRFRRADAPDNGVPFDREQRLELEVLPLVLPAQKLICTNWFYADCLMTHYHVDCWSERHWQLIETYVRNMAEHGINMLMTPLWTLPLDTAVGHERPTVQLLDIELRDGVYTFDFRRLIRWIAIARQCGIGYLEMSHAFTQWGGRFTPKIMIREDGVERCKFGWHIPADSPEYREFLRQLMPPLLALLRELGMAGKCYFHVSDEPDERHLESYDRAMGIFRPLVEDFPIIDALSDPVFLRRGLCTCPVPNTEKLDEFMAEPLSRRWVYYCGNWKNGVPNRQFGMPSSRNRILGLLLYLYDLDGFLNWGYNFWYRQYSLGALDPFLDTTAGRAFCGGGSFQVYPGENGPLDSLHYEVFREGLQDLRFLQLLEQDLGREVLIKLIHNGLDYRIDMQHYPHENAWLPSLRQRLAVIAGASSANNSSKRRAKEWNLLKIR